MLKSVFWYKASFRQTTVRGKPQALSTKLYWLSVCHNTEMMMPEIPLTLRILYSKETGFSLSAV